VKSCPKCKFLLTDLDASCRYCGHLLRGVDADEALPSDGNRGVRVHAPSGDNVARPSAVVRRAGRTAPLPLPDRLHPVVDATFYDRPDVNRPQYSIAGQDEPRDVRRLVMAVVGVALVVVVAVALLLRARGDASPGETPAPVLSWEKVGPPTVPFSAELPGMAIASTLRPFDELTTYSVESSPSSDQGYVVGAFDLPPGALAFGPDAYMKATAQKIAALRNGTFVDGAGSDSASGRIFDGTLTSSGGWGCIHLLIRGPRMYYVAVFAQTSDDGARQNYDRVVQSLVPA
jgi:hypothetical protein